MPKSILHTFKDAFVCPFGKTTRDPDDIPCTTCRHFLGTEQPSGDLTTTAEVIRCGRR